MPGADVLESLLAPTLLYRMAGEVTFERGAAYAREGRVKDVVLTDGMLTAHVEGTETYQVRLWKHGGELEFDCTCPVGDALRFCKHGVAAGLAWLAARGEGGDGVPLPPAPPCDDPMDRVRAFVAAMDEAGLRELLLAEAARDDALRERLLIRETATLADLAVLQHVRSERRAAVPA